MNESTDRLRAMIEEEVGLAGRVIAGKYEIRDLLGEGGMGAVYAAWDIALSRRVAVKVIKPELSFLRGQFLPRFRREAQAAAQVPQHHNVVSIYDYGESEDGLAYIVMEHVDGQNLAEVIRARGYLPLKAAVDIVKQCLRALHMIHRAGVVHRDLKPGNVILTKTGGETGWCAKIADFGLGKIVTGESGPGSAPTLTSAGEALGTPKYMSPEQCAGHRADARSDVYAMGIIFFEMLCGEAPYKGSAGSLIAKHQNHDLPVPRLANVPPDVSAIVRKAMERRPEHRFASAREMLRALERARLERSPSRAGALAVAGFAVMALLGTAGFLLKDRVAGEEPAEAPAIEIAEPSAAPPAEPPRLEPPAPKADHAPAPAVLDGLSADELLRAGERASLEGKTALMEEAYGRFLESCRRSASATCRKNRPFVEARLGRR